MSRISAVQEIPVIGACLGYGGAGVCVPPFIDDVRQSAMARSDHFATPAS